MNTKKLLKTTSYRSWQKIGKVLAVIIPAILATAAIAVLAYNRSHADEAAHESASPSSSIWPTPSASATPTPSATASCTPKPLVMVPMDKVAKKGPTKDQVAGFLAAAVLADPDRRSAALVPFATCEYIASASDGGEDDESLDDLDVKVDLVVIDRVMVSGTTATVTSTFTVESWQDGQLIDPPESQTYTSVWVWTTQGWLAHTTPE